MKVSKRQAPKDTHKMKYRTKVLYSIFTIIILLVGFWMPRLAVRLQTSQLESQVEEYELESVELRVSNQLFEKLRTINGGYYPMEVTEQANTRMTREEVYQTMLTVNDMFGCFVFEDRTNLHWNAEPVLAINENDTFSFVLWQCAMETNEGDMVVIIDDATGKMLSFSTHAATDEAGEYVATVKMTQGDLEDLCQKLNQYYELSEVSVVDDTNAWSAVDGEALYGGDDTYDAGRTQENVSDDTIVYGEELYYQLRLLDTTGEGMEILYYISADGMYSIN